jgi:hypothetical protein
MRRRDIFFGTVIRPAQVRARQSSSNEHKECFAFFRRHLCKGTIEIGWSRGQRPCPKFHFSLC